MLKTLSIINLAVVESLDLNLAGGMSVLTGETGAGKSILLTALGLALGDRADSSYVRPDCQRAEVNLEFDLSDAPLAKGWLHDNDLDDDQNCLVRRVINQDGRSKAYINNRPVTLQFLQNLSEKLVEIHGQHAHLTLLQPDEQRRLLDEYGKNQPLVEQLNSVVRQWQTERRELENLIQTSRDKTEREELLRYQINELDQLDLESFDYPALSEEHTRQANMGQIISSGQNLLEQLYENEQHSVSNMLGQTINELADLARLAPDLDEIYELLSEARIQIEEASLQFRRFLETQEIDPQRLDWLESQIGIVQSICRKHQVSPEELPETAQLLSSEMNNLTHSNRRIEELTVNTDCLKENYQQLATQLSKKRQLAAGKIEDKISSLIQELGMPHGRISINISPLDVDTPKLHGQDKIEFLVCANPGLPAKPIAKVASGGELSRISLAIQVATSNDKTTPTMIFDEVDSGIGGGIAEIVGKRLRSLGQNRQVLCVTHLPQVATQAHQHLHVEKNNQSEITSSRVRLLNNQERVEEVARMLGGVHITEHTLAHAQEMLDSANPNN